uniref:Uncharacterized protein n=1 Tax=Arundo donax TaxID=35708 RepID=A0A0A9BIG0_ARUDO
MVMRFLDCQRIQLSGVAFSSARSLRVLDLSECYIKMLPDSISQLKQLGYLNAPRINHRIIPNCITKLSKLIYLNLSGSSISALPESIGELECLMHLDISNCICIREVPASFGNLKKLVHLDLSYCKMLAVDPKALGGLTNIQYLNLSHPGRSLPIGGMLEIIGNLIELRYLGLSSAIRNAGSAEAFNFIHRICTLSNLEHLDLSRNNSITRLPESIGRLRKLHTLDLVGCIILERLPKCTVQMDSTVNLNAICFVTHADDGESSSNIGLLRHANPEYLHITGLENVKSMEEVKSIEVTKEKRTSFLTVKTRINYLKFEWTRDASRSVDAQEVLEGLVPPSTLHEFSIEGYNSVIFPYWVMDIKQYLPNLVKVSLVGLRKCNSLPPLGQLPNLVELFLAEMDSITTIGHSFCSGATAFPELKKLFLGRMENLQVWITIYSCGKYGKLGSVNEVMFPSLVKLSICDCPKLRMVPCPPRAKEWEIEGSDNVLSSCGDGGQTSASFAPALTDAIVTVKSSKMPLHQWRLLHYLPVITDLSIIRCTGLTYSSPELVHVLSFVRSLHLELSDKLQLPKWLGELKYLRELKISTDCTGLQAPPESLKDLIALRSLRLYDCEILTTTPKWLGQLISLQRLHIWNCTELNDLHGSMRHLWSLQELHLYRCENIVALPEWLGDLASLKELEIRSCRSIKSLPESIPKLAKLENLSIHYCPELAAWCKLEENKKKIAHIKHRRIS